MKPSDAPDLEDYLPAGLLALAGFPVAAKAAQPSRPEADRAVALERLAQRAAKAREGSASMVSSARGLPAARPRKP